MTTSTTPKSKSSQNSSKPKNFHRLRFLSVIGGFLDGQTFNFTEGLNCFIGARGTGKTTALELVRYALDMLPSRESDPAEWRRIDSLVGRNLDGGRIQLGIETKDGLSYLVSRSWGEEPIVLTTDGKPTELTLRCGGLFKADIYSQNEVECIADQTSSQLELIDNFDAQNIAQIDREIQHHHSTLSTNASHIIPLQMQLAVFGEELGMLTSIEERLKAFTNGQGDDAEKINLAHAQKSLRDREQRAISRIQQSLETAGKEVADFVGRLEREVAVVASAEMTQGPNAVIWTEVMQLLSEQGKACDAFLEKARGQLVEAWQNLNSVSTNLATAHKEQELTFRQLIEKHQQAQGQATERTQLEKRRNDLMMMRRSREEIRHKLTASHEERQKLLERLSELRDRRYAIRQSVVVRINKHLLPAIRVSVTQFGNPECYQKLLEDHLRGARMKHGVVAQKLVNAFWPAELSMVIRSKDVQALIDKAELNGEQADKVISTLASPEILFALEVVELLDKPQIELKDGAEYKDSLSLSTGQKCTAILPILLLESENPLLVDQPEDNLDNRFIFETVVGSIRATKERRQLIFVTHNPNIPVLADAERVFVLESNGTAARKANEGSVDECKSEIVTLLEGGEEAFKLRKERYSY